MCCKQKGHSVEECPRDPNIKTSKDMDSEVERLGNCKDFKTVFAETTTQTA